MRQYCIHNPREIFYHNHGFESLQFLSTMVLRAVLAKTVLVEDAKQISVACAKREAGYDNVDEDDDLDIKMV